MGNSPQLNVQGVSSFPLLGQIYENLPEKFYTCNDGTYSDHDGCGACNWHGVLAKKLGTRMPITQIEGNSQQAHIEIGPVFLHRAFV